MRVAKDDDLRLFLRQQCAHGSRGHGEVNDVKDEKFFTVKLDEACLRQIDGEVSIAAHGGDRCDGFQFGDDIHRSYIARVQNVIHPRQRGVHRGGHGAVGIGDDAKLHGGSVGKSNGMAKAGFLGVENWAFLGYWVLGH